AADRRGADRSGPTASGRASGRARRGRADAAAPSAPARKRAAHPPSAPVERRREAARARRCRLRRRSPGGRHGARPARARHRGGRAMKRSLLALLVLSFSLPAEAQTSFARRRVSAGEVTGLEMGIEGSLSTVPGGRVRWYLTLYEVVRRRDLRPSPRSTIRATATYAPDAPIAEVPTDASGRASLELAIPEELATSPHLMLEAISPRGVRRVFEVSLALEPRFTVELFVDRSAVPPGASVAAFGRVIDGATGARGAAHEVTLQASDRGPLGQPITRRTDSAGVFAAERAMPDSPGSARVMATIEGH